MNQNKININNNVFIDNYKNDIFQLSKQEFNDIKKECTHYENIRAASIEALKIIQKNRGWVSDDAVKLISKILHMSIADVEGVATFYNQIFRQPVGRHIIRFCDSVVCYLTGYKKIQKTLEYILNIAMGGTTLDNRFTLLPTCCLGVCDKSPVIMINEDVYMCVDSEKIAKLLERYQ